MKATITTDDLLAEMERLAGRRPVGDRGLTTREISEGLGISQPTALSRIVRPAVRTGRLRPGRSMRTNIVGVAHPATVWVLVSPKRRR